MRLLRILVTGLSLLLATACSDSKKEESKASDPFTGTFTKVRCNPNTGTANAPETFTVVKTGERKYTLTMNGISVPLQGEEFSSQIKVVDYCKDRIVDLTMSVSTEHVMLESFMVTNNVCPPQPGFRVSYDCVYRKQ